MQTSFTKLPNTSMSTNMTNRDRINASFRSSIGIPEYHITCIFFLSCGIMQNQKVRQASYRDKSRKDLLCRLQLSSLLALDFNR